MTTQFASKTGIVPKEIVRDTHTIDGKSESYLIAWFSYYDGTRLATQKGLRHTTDFKKVLNETHFMVCCGDVCICIKPWDYPTIKRKSI